MCENCNCGTKTVGQDELYLPLMSKIKSVKTLTANEKLFQIELPDGKHLGHKPGQFVQVSVFGFGEAPISISSAPAVNGSFELCVRNVGSLTNKLHQITEGETVGIRGPFGNGFDMSTMHGKDVMIIAGGIGLAPVRSVINQINAERDKFGQMKILYGTKEPADLLYTDELKSWDKIGNNEVLVTVDQTADGWDGNVGVVTTLFKKTKINPANTVAIACGPPIMYKFVYLELQQIGFDDKDIYFSLERKMKCGVGKCGHCQIDGKYACVDGPVFSAKEIQELHESIK